MSDTRWSCQAKQFVWKRLDIICEVLQDVIDNDTNPQRKIQATGYLLQINHRVVRYLYFIRLVLMKAKYSSDFLQRPSNELTEAIELVGTLKAKLRLTQIRELSTTLGSSRRDICDLELTRKRPTCSSESTATSTA